MKHDERRSTRILASLRRNAATIAAVLLVAAVFALGYWVRGIGSSPRKESTEAGAGASAPPANGGPSREAAAEATPMYTCSMHPQVRLSDPDAKCPICFMDLIPVSEDAGAPGSERHLVLSEAAVRLAGVQTTPVARFFPTATVRLYGKVTYDRTQVSRITAYFAGRLDRLFVDYVGTPVRKGDHLAEIYSPDLLATFEELRQSRLAVEESRSGSQVLRASTSQTLEAAREKLRLFGLTAEQIEAAERGEMKSDHLTVYSPIGGIVTHLAALEGDYVETGSPIATVADLSRLWLDLEAYESQLPLVRWGQQVTFTVESHPGETFEGQISFIEPMVDDYTRTAAVRVTIDNRDGRLKPGMFATAVARTRVGTRGAIPSGNLAGKWVSPMHPEIVKDAPGSCDVCGMPLVPAEELGIVGDPTSVEEPLVVPRTAVLVTGVRAVAYVEVPGQEKPTFEGREVVLGPRAGDFYILLGGLREGESVVTNAAFKIDSAMQIAAKPSMMMPRGGRSTGHSHHGGPPPETAPDASTPSTAAPEHFLSALEPVYQAYLDLQEALADDDLSAALGAAGRLERAVGLVDPAGVSGEPLGIWRRSAALLAPAEPPADLETARERFESMSRAAVDLLRRFGNRAGTTLRLAFCPMAFDDRGAEWVQRGEGIDNPYSGASMLRCGVVREEFAPVDPTGKDAEGSPAPPPNAEHDHGAHGDTPDDGERRRDE